MKVAFDENVPVQMVRVFASLGQEKRFRDFQFVSAKDYAPKQDDHDYVKGSDVPWLERFAEDGGKVVISGNTRMMDNPLEMQALRQLGFLVFFFEKKWNGLDFFQKSAVILFYWNRIASKIKKGKMGKFWRIPNHFKTDDALRDLSPGKKSIKKAEPKISGRKTQAAVDQGKLDGSDRVHTPKGRRKRRPKPVSPDQDSFTLIGGGLREHKT